MRRTFIIRTLKKTIMITRVLRITTLSIITECNEHTPNHHNNKHNANNVVIIIITRTRNIKITSYIAELFLITIMIRTNKTIRTRRMIIISVVITNMINVNHMIIMAIMICIIRLVAIVWI